MRATWLFEYYVFQIKWIPSVVVLWTVNSLKRLGAIFKKEAPLSSAGFGIRVGVVLALPGLLKGPLAYPSDVIGLKWSMEVPH